MPNIIDFMSVVSVFTTSSVFFAYFVLRIGVYTPFHFRVSFRAVCSGGRLVRYSRMHAEMPKKEVLRSLYGQKNGETLLCLL